MTVEKAPEFVLQKYNKREYVTLTAMLNNSGRCFTLILLDRYSLIGTEDTKAFQKFNGSIAVFAGDSKFSNQMFHHMFCKLSFIKQCSIKQKNSQNNLLDSISFKQYKSSICNTVLIIKKGICQLNSWSLTDCP